MTTGLVVGVVLGLQVSDKLQVDITPPAFAHPNLGDLIYQVSAAALTAAFFALPATPRRGRCWVPGWAV